MRSTTPVAALLLLILDLGHPINVINVVWPPPPVAEKTNVEFKAVTDTEWEKCTWYLNGVQVCTQRPTPGSVLCFNETQRGSNAPSQPQSGNDNFVSGGSYEPRACKLNINKYNRDNSGNWTVEVRAFDSNPMDQSWFQHYSTLPPAMSFNSLEEIEIAYHEPLILTCTGRYGRPMPDRFKWLIDGREDFGDNAIFSPFKRDSLQTDEYGFGIVTQTLTWTPDPVDELYQIQCVSVQSSGGYADDNYAFVKVWVSKKGSQRGLSGGWIAFIVIMSVLVVAVIIILIFLILTGRLACQCLGGKKKKSKKQKRAEAAQRMAELAATPRTAQQQGRYDSTQPEYMNYGAELTPQISNKYPDGMYPYQPSSTHFSPIESPPAIPARMDRRISSPSAFHPVGPNYASHRRPPPPPFDLSLTKSPLSKSPVNRQHVEPEDPSNSLTHPRKQYFDDFKGDMV